MNKNQKTTILKCTQTTATIIFILVGTLFILTGCARFYDLIGLTEEQTTEQISEDQETIIRTVTQVRTTAGEIITTAIAAIGTIATGFLTKWLHTEKKITQAVITGVEDAHASDVKASIKRNATAAGVESKLAARVKVLT